MSKAGAVSRRSTVLHGVWVLICAGLLAGALEQIPLAALAALVMVVGIRMVSFAHIRHVQRHREFPVYAATLGGGGHPRRAAGRGRRASPWRSSSLSGG